MNVRHAIADALTAGLPSGYLVRGYPYEPDAVTRPTVMLWQSLLERGEQIDDRVALRVTVEVWVLVSTEDPSKADDALDDALDDVLSAVHAVSFIEWSVAERGVLLDRFHGYRITAQAVATIGEN